MAEQRAEGPCPWCGDMDDGPVHDVPLLVECLACEGWFVWTRGAVDVEATMRLAEAAPAS